jgi:hypothetical protein
VESSFCRTRHRGGLKIFLDYGKKNRFLASYFFRKNVLFKESPPSIMVTRKPDWSIEIIWYETGYVKRKILSPLKRFAWGRLHCWFCRKLLNIYSLILWWFVYNIPDSGVNEYSISNIFNSGVGKDSTMNNFNSGVKFIDTKKSVYFFLFPILISINKLIKIYFF